MPLKIVWFLEPAKSVGELNFSPKMRLFPQNGQQNRQSITAF